METVDATVSVWNRFWCPQMIAGLGQAGYRIEALGSTRRGPPAATYATCWPSGILTQLMYRFPFSRQPLRTAVLQGALDIFDRWASRQWEETRCFWGWNGHNLRSFERARRKGIPGILETGSTHAHWSHRILVEEYQRRGMKVPPDRISPRRHAACREYELATCISVPSRFVANTFIDQGIPASCVNVNPFGVDVDFWARERPERAPRSLTFVFAGLIGLRKGMFYLLEAWKRLAPGGHRLVLAGPVDPDFLGCMRALPRGVSYEGIKTREEILRLYEESDVFLLPSLEEGMARAVLEAMAAGLPVIITEETGCTDVMRDGQDGYLVRAADTDSLLDALERAVRDKDGLPDIGASARRRVRPYTWEAYGARCAAFLEEVIGPPSAA